MKEVDREDSFTIRQDEPEEYGQGGSYSNYTLTLCLNLSSPSPRSFSLPLFPQIKRRARSSRYPPAQRCWCEELTPHRRVPIGFWSKPKPNQ